MANVIRLNLQRDTDVFYSSINLNGANIQLMNPTNTFKIEILAGYAMSQDTSVQDITSAESGLTPDRSTQRFITALNQVQYSFRSYIRPTGLVAGTANEGNSRPVADWFLWQALLSNTNPISPANSLQSAWQSVTFDSQERPATTNAAPHNPNFSVPVTNYLYFKMGNVIYQLSNASVNQAEVDGSIDDIASVTWSGFATDLRELFTNRDNAISVFGGTLSNGTTIPGNARVTLAENSYQLMQSYHPFEQANVSGTIRKSPFIVNRLSSLGIKYVNELGVQNIIEIPITRASLTYTNNITFIAPEEIDRVNRLAGQFAASRSISGQFAAYLRAGSAETGALLANLLDDSRTSLSIACNANLRLGGNTAPNMTFYMPAVHFSLPVHEINDIVGVSVDFQVQEPSYALGDGGELVIQVRRT